MALVDDILIPINASLQANLSWLTWSYGKIDRLRDVRSDNKEVRYPGISTTGDKLYTSLLPDTKLGNFSYFEVFDPIEHRNELGNIQLSFKFKLVIWFYWPDLYVDWQDRTLEEVKAQVLNVLTASHYTRSVDVFDFYEDVDKIYQGFDHDEIEHQFLMRPYGGFAIEGNLVGLTTCPIDLPTPSIPQNLFGTIPVTESESEQVWPYKKALGGKTIYWKQWNLTAADAIAELTGLLKTYKIVNLECSYYDADGVWQPHFPNITTTATTYAVQTYAGIGGFKITGWYWKP